MATTDRARWEEHFAAVIMTGNRGEIEAATRGALAALRAGADDALAKEAGRTALRHYRARQPTPIGELDPAAQHDPADALDPGDQTHPAERLGLAAWTGHAKQNTLATHAHPPDQPDPAGYLRPIGWADLRDPGVDAPLADDPGDPAEPAQGGRRGERADTAGAAGERGTGEEQVGRRGRLLGRLRRGSGGGTMDRR